MPLFKKTKELLAEFDERIKSYDAIEGAGVYDKLIDPKHFQTVGSERVQGQPPTDEQHTSEEAYLDFMLALITTGRVAQKNVVEYTKQILKAGPEIELPKSIPHVPGKGVSFAEAIEQDRRQRQMAWLNANRLGLFFAAYAKMVSVDPEDQKSILGLIRTKLATDEEDIQSLDQSLLHVYRLLLRSAIQKESPETQLSKDPELTKPKNFREAIKVYDTMLGYLDIIEPILPNKVSDQFKALQKAAEDFHSKNPVDAPILIDSLYHTARLLHGDIDSKKYLQVAKHIKKDTAGRSHPSNVITSAHHLHNVVNVMTNLMIALGLALIALGIFSFGTTTPVGLGIVSIATGVASVPAAAAMKHSSHRLFKEEKATQAAKERLGTEMEKLEKHAPKPGESK